MRRGLVKRIVGRDGILNSKINPDVIKRAEANGIRKHTLETRVYTNGWDVEEAVNTPLKKNAAPWAVWKDVALENGVSCGCFYNRLSRGCSGERAATTKTK